MMDEQQTETTQTEPMDQKQAMEAIKTFNPLTFAGVGLILLFVILCFIGGLSIRWWLMVPVAVAGVALLMKQKTESTGLELQVCTYGIWAMVAVFLLRDIMMAHQVATVVDGFSDVMNNFNF
ncbi:hypothetical protein [Desulfoluna spongiiphila]|nr:hypothetical protein [Desulfoluna spongiiphila]